MPLWQSIGLFAVSALVARLSVYSLMPALIHRDVAPFWAFIARYGLFLSLMIVAALVALRMEGRPLTAHSLSARYRFHRLHGKDWLWTLGIFVVGFLGTGLLAPTRQPIARMPLFAPPDWMPSVLNPLQPQRLSLSEFMGVSLRGNWWVAVVFFLFLACLNILGEELWFRGYILPRQELTHGRWTWAVHGVLWTLFHVPIYPWYLIYLLPTALTVSFAAQKLRNTWASYTVHFLGNGLTVLIPLILGIAAVGT